MRELVGAFNLGHVAAIVDYDQLRARDLLVETLAEARRNQFICATPDDKRRFMDRAEAPVERIVAANDRVHHLVDDVTIAGSYVLFKCQIDILVEPLLVKCQRPEILDVFVTGQRSANDRLSGPPIGRTRPVASSDLISNPRRERNSGKQFSDS